MTEQMQCMEVWGGNQGVEQHIQLPGQDVWLYSRPYDNATNEAMSIIFLLVHL